MSGATVGKLAMYDTDEIALLNQRVGKFNIKDKKVLDNMFLLYLLKSEIIQSQIVNMSSGCAQPNISGKQLESIEFKLPPIEEQERIVSILERAESAKKKREESLIMLDELVKSRFIELFGDPIKNPNKFPVHSLMDCYDRNDAVKCGPFGSALKKDEYTEIGIPVWNMDNISKKCDFFDTPNLWITNEKYETLKNYETKNGDIIISRAGTVGKMSVVKSVYDKSIISTNLIRLRLNEKIVPIYFIMLINIFGNKVCRLQTGSDGAFTHMNTGVLNSIEIPVPAIELQNEFVNFINQVDKLKFEMEGSLKELENNFNSLMQRAFNGEL